MKSTVSAKPSAGRFNTTNEVKRVVWIRAAGHCELCGNNLTHDYRVGTPMNWGEVAHILPASPKGPRGNSTHSGAQALALTNDCSNLMLLCPNCHDRIDRDEDGYPEEDLSGLHQAQLERINLAASSPKEGRAIPLIVQSQHFETVNDIPAHELLRAMSSEGLTAFGHPIKIIFPRPGPIGRDNVYWQNVKNEIQHRLTGELNFRGGQFGDVPAIAVVGLADIPALMMLGQSIGDRSKRFLFSSSRSHQLRWPDKSALPPEFRYTPAPDGEGPLALVISISATISHDDVTTALPGARIAEFTIDEPGYSTITNREVIYAFSDQLQRKLSQIEAASSAPIHVFSAIPAAFAIEFGALLTTQHQHPYVIFDRDKTKQNAFQSMLNIGHSQEPS
ncbi:HNH endonuclease [Xenorhabdus bovienii]|uniref:SMODS-associated and fused to various effectors domain-containing protein n=1 Tax=Xenorhabdus bovienii str. kraussei Becker Underwood TaxID=1398204 RepID=A0A077PS64_XENBV|nr:SAVED domain-containing protein [Xenorhabdus bovienii]CDH23576.1 hypothetical protein XBKB1_1880002 [Xenorhabdus bovienii str. kraussei Becker Underwood]